MMRFWILGVLLCVVGGQQCCGQEIKAVMAKDIKAMAHSSDTVYVFNFWATWCAPCVKELPAFNRLCKEYLDKPVRIVLISLDFKADYPEKIQNFLRKKPMLPQVAWLAETDPNVFIPALENGWEGSIPATIFVRPGKGKGFKEGALDYGDLKKEVNALLELR